MSALAMILAATMAVPADGPKKVSGKMAEEPLLPGRWEGTLTMGVRENYEANLKLKLSDGVAKVSSGDETITSSCIFTRTGKDTVRLKLDKGVYDGIYKTEQGRILLCFNGTTGKRPSSFKVRPGTMLFTLQRVKPRK